MTLSGFGLLQTGFDYLKFSRIQLNTDQGQPGDQYLNIYPALAGTFPSQGCYTIRRSASALHITGSTFEGLRELVMFRESTRSSLRQGILRFEEGSKDDMKTTRMPP
jgi:hypothetical protein